MDRVTRVSCIKGMPTEEGCMNVNKLAGLRSEDIENISCAENTTTKTLSSSSNADKENYRKFENPEFKKKYYGNKFSILGDSISTYEGYNPKGYKVFYDKDTGLRAGIKSAADTWWDKVIRFFGGELLVNNSWSGSRVTILPGREYDELFPSACSPRRTSNLHQEDVTPDVIIINIGVNDWANGVSLEEPTDIVLPEMFYGSFVCAYKELVLNIKRNYPGSEIWCCTLCETFIPANPKFKFPHEYAGVHIEKYNDVIREIAQKNQCLLVDLYKYHTPYASLDGTHPTKDGMCTIANLIIKEVSDADAYIDTNPDATPVNFVDNWLEICKQSDGSTQSTYGDIIKAGRNPDCKLWINTPGVSRHHATFFFELGSWYLRDENSTNKTYLNGITVQPGKKYKLHIGDAIFLGPEEFYLFKDYDTAHNYEIYDEHVAGGTYYQCKRCGFKAYAHAIQMESLGYRNRLIIPPCRSRKYTLCSCGKIMGDGRNGTCICSDGKPRLCPYCGLQIDGHHTCKEALEIDEMVKQLHGNEPQKEKRKITKRHLLAWCILGIMGIFVAVGVWFLIFGV